METIAIYWEKQVKVYGIILKSGFTLVRFQRGVIDSFPWHTLLTYFESKSVKFELIISALDHNNEIILTLVLAPDQLLTIQNTLVEIQKNGEPSFTLSYKKIDLIYLHGPHFQERFGILSKAIEPLSSHHIKTTLTGCAGNSMYIVVPEGQGPKSNEILHNTFHIPKTA